MWKQLIHFECCRALKCLFVLPQTCNLGHSGIRNLPRNTWISKSAPPGTNKDFPRTQSHKINKWGNLPHLCPWAEIHLFEIQSFWQKKKKAGKGRMQITVGGRVSSLRYYITVRDGCSAGLLTHSSVIVCISVLACSAVDKITGSQ